MSDRKNYPARNAPPRAAAMVEALRGLGYSTETAMADLIDNSISAGASRVEIDFNWHGTDSWVAIRDNGLGMSDAELDTAMRLGEKNPLHHRDEADLGRFGLGLKTASFSQARRLTVYSLKDGETSCLRWDLDVLAHGNGADWSLLEGAHEGSKGKLVIPGNGHHGTVVLWENLDRMVSSTCRKQDFLDLIDRVERHLSMIFHRFMDGSGRSIELLLNGQKVSPWDPFLSTHSATWRSPEFSIGEGNLRILAQAFVLPHKDRLSDNEYLDAGGPEGWHSQQGFYIYRGRRLILAGSWLGLGRGRSWPKDESHRLARIRLDILNSSDADWKIDIRKSSAQPPAMLREHLTKLAEDVRNRARKVFMHRGQSIIATGRGEGYTQVWRSIESPSGRRYQIDREHPAVKAIVDDARIGREGLESLLRMLEDTIPVQRIWLEASEVDYQDKHAHVDPPDMAVLGMLETLYHNLVTKGGMSPDSAKDKLLNTEPFDLYPDTVKNLPNLGQEH